MKKDLNFSLICRLKVQGKGASMVMSGEDSFPGFQVTTFLLCPHITERKSKLSDVSSHKNTNPIMRAPP